MEALVERGRPSELRGGRFVSRKIEKRPSVWPKADVGRNVAIKKEDKKRE
jgi:hypothetical protein